MNINLEDKFSNFLNTFKKSIDENKSLYASSSNPDFELLRKLFISFDAREVKIEGVKHLHYFLIIHDIELNPEFKGFGFFTKMIDFLNSQKVNVWVDDIVNNRLFAFLHDKGYRASIYKSSIGWTSCMYKLKSENE